MRPLDPPPCGRARPARRADRERRLARSGRQPGVCRRRELRRHVRQRLRRAVQPRKLDRRPLRLVAAVRDGVRHELAGDRARRLARARSPLPRRASPPAARTARRCPPPTRQARRTSLPRAGRSRSSTTRPRSPAERPPEAAARWRSSATSSGTDRRPTSKAAPRRRSRARPRRVPGVERLRRHRRERHGLHDRHAGSAHHLVCDDDLRGTPPPAGSASGAANVALDLQSTLSIALEKPTLSFGNVAPGDSPAALTDRITVTSTNGAGYTLSAHRSAFTPADLPLGLSATAPPTGAAWTGAGRRCTGAASGRAGRRPARRHDGGAERRLRRRLADEPRFHLAAPDARVGPLHGHRHLHGDRSVTGALLLVAAPATAMRSPSRRSHRRRRDRR